MRVPSFRAEQTMMLSMLGEPSPVDAFEFYLATKLGKTWSEIRALPFREYVYWAAYFKSMKAMGGTGGGLDA